MEKSEVEEIKRHFGVIAEGLRIEICQVAEGHEVIRQEMREFREEVRNEFKEVKSLIKISYAELDQRIRTLEESVSFLQGRMARLEARQ